MNKLKVLITAGGTVEKIDNVREISKISSGRLGSLIADTLSNDYDVTYLHGKHALIPQTDCHKIAITDTVSLLTTMQQLFDQHHYDVIIHAMAISDYHVDKVIDMNVIIDNILKLSETETLTQENLEKIIFNNSFHQNQKIDSSIDNLVFKLHKNIKVLDIIKQYQPQAFLFSFKLQSNISSERLLEIAETQRIRSNSDVVIANLVEEISNDQHHAYFVSEQSNIIEAHTKQEIATQIATIIKEQL